MEIKKNTNFKSLITPFEKDSDNNVWTMYPRPQMVRDSYICLNGKWDIEILSKENCKFKGEITVPFPIPSRLSGVIVDIEKDDSIIYRRSFEISEDFVRDKILLHFGAVDQICEIYINGNFAGKNVGGYLPFCIDITDYYKIGENTLEVRVIDNLDTDLPYGKQRRKRGGMWYTPISGIWQTVWLESVCKQYIELLKVNMDMDCAEIEVIGGVRDKIIHFEGKKIAFSGSKVTLKPENPELWSPENPKLYDFVIESGEDRVASYFALRKIEIENNKILLNGKPYFFNGLLDQGYFSDGIYLPASVKGYEYDILTAKEMGFNMLRKHIKIEPQIFYYLCDKYGMVVFQDMVNNGKYNFILQTALPTIGMKKRNFSRASEKCRKYFEETAVKTIDFLYSHPSVCYYTIFNEGWGQYDAKNMYSKLKNLDNSRVWDATSGWFQTGESDVLSEHVYFKPVKLKADERPLILSEFGGYSCEIENHSFNPGKSYGYKKFKNKTDFENAIIDLYRKEIIPAIHNGLCGAVLTQISDVEDETNGLVTYDRQVIKMDKEKMKALSEEIKKEHQIAVGESECSK